jgi:hypothetical protein
VISVRRSNHSVRGAYYQPRIDVFACKSALRRQFDGRDAYRAAHR